MGAGGAERRDENRSLLGTVRFPLSSSNGAHDFLGKGEVRLAEYLVDSGFSRYRPIDYGVFGADTFGNHGLEAREPALSHVLDGLADTGTRADHRRQEAEQFGADDFFFTVAVGETWTLRLMQYGVSMSRAIQAMAGMETSAGRSLE